MKSKKIISYDPEPSNIVGHWCLVCLDFASCSASYIDSLGLDNSFVDFSTLERVSLKIMNAINNLRVDQVELPTNVQYLPTQGSMLRL